MELRKEYEQSLEKEVDLYKKHNQQLVEYEEKNTQKINQVQQWLNKNYPTKQEKESLKEIIIWPERETIIEKDKIVTGHPIMKSKETSNSGILDLSEYPNLEKIWICGRWKNNKYLNTLIENVKLNKCEKLVSMNFYGNNLSSINFLVNLPYPEKIEELFLGNNNIEPTDLEFLEKFINLERIILGFGNAEKIIRGRCNRFYGSLKPLRNLNKLEALDISATDIDSGLEYLPRHFISRLVDANIVSEGVIEKNFNLIGNYIYYSFNFFPIISNTGVVRIWEQLKNCKNISGKFDIQKWREANQGLLIKVQKELQDQIQPLKTIAKDKLSSNHVEEQIWEIFLNNSEVLTTSEQELLEKKLTTEFLTNFNQIHTELIRLQKELVELQTKSQTQIQVPPKN